MGLFDKLKSLVSDDKKDSELLRLLLRSPADRQHRRRAGCSVAEKIVGDGIAIKPTGNKMVAPVDGTIGKILKPTMRSLSNPIAVSNCSFTSVSTPLN